MARLCLLLVTLALVVGACGSDGAIAVREVESRPTTTPEPDVGSSPATPEPSPSPGSGATPEPTSPVALEVWLNRGERLFPVTRIHPFTQGVARAAMEELLAGPTAAETALGLGTQVPGGTDLLDITISNRIAIVDLSGEFGSGGGSASVSMRLAQVVYTVTQFPTVDAVRFKLDGRFVDAISGQGVVVDEPAKRKDYEDLLAPIVVHRPYIGQEVSSPVEISGTANVFEATVSIRILDANGRAISKTFTTATCGSGCRGDYLSRVRFEVSTRQRGTIEVYESSAEDGRAINVVSIPVVLAP